MRLHVVTLLALLAVCSVGCRREDAVPPPQAMQAQARGWERHCSLDGIHFANADERKFMKQFVDRCDAQDACTLACERSGCAYGVGGGCFHACGGFGIDDPARGAEEFAAKTSFFCKWQRPKT